MKNFEYNWATAEMAKMYLRNSRAQAKRKARNSGGLPAAPIAQDAPATNSGLTAASGSVGGDFSDDEDSDDSDDDEDDNDA